MFFHQKQEMNSSDFFRAHWSRHLCCKALVDRQAHIQPTSPSIFIEGTSSLVTLSPTLVDPALVSVIRAVDGQDTGLSAQPAEQPTSDRHRPGLSSSERTGPGFSAFKASADQPAQKNATSDVISSQPIACPSYLITKLVTCCHRPGRSEMRSSKLTSTVITVPALQTRPCCR